MLLQAVDRWQVTCIGKSVIRSSQHGAKSTHLYGVSRCSISSNTYLHRSAWGSVGVLLYFNLHGN